MELVLERCVSFSSPTGVFSTVALLMMIAAVPAYSQISPVDTVARKAAASSRITVTIIHDTSGHGADTLSSGRNSLRNAEDTLAVSPDTSMHKKDTIAVKKDTLEILTSNASYDTVPGFRVQILTTQSLNKAITVKTKADSLLSNYNVYIVYDSPYYKVRVGNFRARYEANQAIPYVADHGFPNAWLVPDNVFRNPAHRAN